MRRYKMITVAMAILVLAPAQAEETSILLFGHSFGVDSTEHLPALLDAAGIRSVRLGRFVKANCSLEEHYNFFVADTLDSNYTYYECAPGSTAWQSRSLTMKQVVSERAWDYVIFQNSLENEGRYETAQPYLNNLVAYVRSRSQELFAHEPVICWNKLQMSEFKRLRKNLTNELKKLEKFSKHGLIYVISKLLGKKLTNALNNTKKYLKTLHNYEKEFI